MKGLFMLYTLKEFYRIYSERIVMWIAWHLPKYLVRWCFVRVATFCEPGNPGETSCGDALDRWIAQP